MAGKKVRLTARKDRKSAETLCTGMIAQVATLGWSFVRMACPLPQAKGIAEVCDTARFI